MEPAGSRRPVRGIVPVVLFALALLLVALPAVGPARAAPVPALPSAPVLGSSATWNGHNVTAAGSAGTAFKVNTNERVLVNFSFEIATGAQITTARLIVYYFGAEISANSVAANPLSGTAQMNWTLGTYTYLLQGIYRLSVSLVYGNGSTAWSQGFYINAQAPYRIASGATIFLIVLGLAEIYWIATVARGPRRPKGRGTAPPTPWEPAQPATPPAAEPPDPAATGPAPEDEA
ncbi:MAG TPA: hypothetical protein VMG36_06155 [Thermoplasmata archaeon]|nr:hypothetical protein [Thermoplasmata archaeon]